MPTDQINVNNLFETLYSGDSWLCQASKAVTVPNIAVFRGGASEGDWIIRALTSILIGS